MEISNKRCPDRCTFWNDSSAEINFSDMIYLVCFTQIQADKVSVR